MQSTTNNPTALSRAETLARIEGQLRTTFCEAVDLCLYDAGQEIIRAAAAIQRLAREAMIEVERSQEMAERDRGSHI